MTHSNKPSLGQALWHDLTVKDAESVRDFYQSVVGWQVKPVDMGGYQDFSMQCPDTGQDQAGICHAQGGNAELPAQWLIYFSVADLDKSMEEVNKAGGKCLTPVKHFGDSRYVVIEDPAGAVCALYQP
ncbi:VOC family protein [Aliiglaciecola sp. CAU 1673]|uniref:VOC family protein n=1 Tax=Aliiglaciecola sp. CAU 1673 TaxID=3032595 RepID=UPI0023DB75AB|nr:VOC family protein [Aliiglaciecola sp. CAU 1673]MDF2177738.1 VOC family protein [Aliiglaciecola sp. CAU 1673]